MIGDDVHVSKVGKFTHSTHFPPWPATKLDMGYLQTHGDSCIRELHSNRRAGFK